MLSVCICVFLHKTLNNVTSILSLYNSNKHVSAYGRPKSFCLNNKLLCLSERSLTSTSRCFEIVAGRSLIKDKISAWNCSQHGLRTLTIISINGIMIAAEFFKLNILTLWAPQAECRLVASYSREVRHLHGQYLWNLSTHIKTIQSD